LSRCEFQEHNVSAESLTPSAEAGSPQSLLERYLAAVDRLDHAVRDLSPSDWEARPGPGDWSCRQVLCHLADSEALFAERMKRVLIEDTPALPFQDPNRALEVLASNQRDMRNELNLLRALRTQMATILKSQPEAAWQRLGHHSREGSQTLRQLLHKAVVHFEHHVAFLEAKCQTLRETGSRPASPPTEAS